MIEPSLVNKPAWVILSTPCGCEFYIPINNETEKSNYERTGNYECTHGTFTRDKMTVVEDRIE